jgi:hypothetical protein
VAKVLCCRKRGDRQAQAAQVERQRARPCDDVDARVGQQQRRRDRAALMVAGHDDDCNAGRRELQQRRRGSGQSLGRGPRDVEEITRVDDQVDVMLAGGGQHAAVAAQEIVAAARAAMARAGRQPGADVGVGGVQDAQRPGHARQCNATPGRNKMEVWILLGMAGAAMPGK